MIGQNTLDYSILDHTADLGFEIKGSDPADLFKKAGKALIHLIFGDIPSEGINTMKVTLTGADFSDLMVRWLSEVLYLFDGEHLITADIAISDLLPTKIEAVLTTLPFDPLRHEVLREIKAVTYHQIDVTEKDGVWKARVIFDL